MSNVIANLAKELHQEIWGENQDQWVAKNREFLLSVSTIELLDELKRTFNIN